jgi:hypothetical protein
METSPTTYAGTGKGRRQSCRSAFHSRQPHKSDLP